MKPTIEILGVYPVEGSELPCHLIECVVRADDLCAASSKIFHDCSHIRPGLTQAAYDTVILTPSGGQAEPPVCWRNVGGRSEIRVAFFMHYVNFDKPLVTCAGDLALPPPQPRPDRLSFIKYILPD